MTPDDRRRALLETIAADLELRKAGRVLKQCGRSPATVHHVLHGKNHRIGTLVDIADALNCDVEIRIIQRPA